MRTRVPMFVWIGGGVILALFALAGWLALTGHSEGIKLALFVGLSPALALTAAWLLAVLREPGWYRSVRHVIGFLFCAGSVLWVAPFLVWLPFSPERWGIEALPLFLSVPFVLGLVLFSVGVVVDLVFLLIDGWRERDYVTVASAVFGLGTIGIVAAIAFATRLG